MLPIQHNIYFPSPDEISEIKPRKRITQRIQSPNCPKMQQTIFKGFSNAYEQCICLYSGEVMLCTYSSMSCL